MPFRQHWYSCSGLDFAPAPGALNFNSLCRYPSFSGNGHRPAG